MKEYLTMRTCDTCGQPATKTYGITIGINTIPLEKSKPTKHDFIELDLCENCARPDLEKIKAALLSNTSFKIPVLGDKEKEILREAVKNAHLGPAQRIPGNDNPLGRLENLSKDLFFNAPPTNPLTRILSALITEVILVRDDMAKLRMFILGG
jgi:hypothetical protein